MHIDTESARQVHLQRCRDIADCRRNRDDLSIENAVRNIMAGKPAHLSMAGGSALGASCALAATANSVASLFASLDKLASFYAVRGVDIASVLLDKLIPLNAAAIDELELCYRLQSTFRDRAEIVDRERKAIMDPWWPTQWTDSESSAWGYSEDYRAAQDRYTARLMEGHWSRPVTAAKPLGIVAALQGVA